MTNEMTTYRISARTAAGETLALIDAETVEHAARIYTLRHRGGDLATERVTGDPGLSGCFQPYRFVRAGEWSSAGEQFHVGKGI